MLHVILLHQLRKLGLDAQSPPSPAAWREFLARVSRAHVEADGHRDALERSLELSSRELTQLNEEMRQRLRETATLLAVSRAVGSNLATEEAMSCVARETARALGADMVGAYLYRPDRGYLEPIAGYHVPTELRASFLQHPIAIQGHEAFERVWTEQRALVTSDARRDPRFPLDLLERWPIGSLLFSPMVVDGDPVGALIVAWWEDRTPLAEAALRLAEGISRQAALAIRNALAAEALRAAHARTEQILASISWILVAVDGDRNVTRWNGAAEAAFGIARGEAMGRRLVELPIPWASDQVADRLSRATGNDGPVRLDDVRYRRPDGTEGLLTLTADRLKLGSGPVPGILLLGSDITERRLLELQLAQAQKLESIGQLAAGVAHELNTPIQFVGDNARFLRTAFGDLQALLEGYATLRDAAAGGPASADLLAEVRRREDAADLGYLHREIPAAIDQALDGVQRVATIVRALKEFAHPDRKEPIPVDLNQALLNTLTVARNEIRYVAEVETDLGDLPPVVCQPGELNQAFLNLIVNAAHAIAEVVGRQGGRGRLGVRTSCEGDDTVLVSISDTGPGIPDEVRGRIFDPFFTTKDVGRGTGQGLTIARAIVLGHGGRLTFETAVGRGTTFHVRLPRADGGTGGVLP